MKQVLIPLVTSCIVCTSIGCSVPFKVALKEHDKHFVPTVDANQGLVYFYREYDFYAGLRGMYILLNGKRIGALNVGTYFVYVAQPGRHVFCAEYLMGDPGCRSMNVEPGKTYYVRGFLKEGFFGVIHQLSVVYDVEGGRCH